MKSTLFVLVAGCAVGVTAQPVVPVALTGGTQGSFFAPEDDSNDASAAAWFTFTLGAVTDVDIDFNRDTADPDLIAGLYAGDVTGFDATAAVGLIDTLTIGGDVGPLTFIDIEDDTEDDAFGGPFGDPRFTLELAPGTYSIWVASLSPVDGGFFSVTSNVPAPASAALLGLGGLAAARRRR